VEKTARAAFVFLALASLANSFQSRLANRIDGYFDALANASFGNVYSDDGAGDGSITALGKVLESGPTVLPLPVVKAIVDLKSSALSALIDRLDSTRATRISFKGKPVPLGYLALDILTKIVRETDSIFIKNCADDGLGACIEPGSTFDRMHQCKRWLP
jgi:hypothetical protein